MQRDEQYIKNLLAGFLEHDEYIVEIKNCPAIHLNIDDIPKNDMKQWFHIQLLCDVGYLKEFCFGKYRLTWQGI